MKRKRINHYTYYVYQLNEHGIRIEAQDLTASTKAEAKQRAKELFNYPRFEVERNYRPQSKRYVKPQLELVAATDDWGIN